MLLPEPLTPETTIILPNGNDISTFFKLLPHAPDIVRSLPLPFLREEGIDIVFLPERYFPVIDSLDFNICFGSPEKTISPPCSPAPGPISIIWSADSIVS